MSTNPNTAAIAALANAIATQMLNADHLATEAREAAAGGRMNEAAGALVALEESLEAARSTISAALVLHRLNGQR